MKGAPEPRARLTPSAPPSGGRVLPFRRASVRPRRRRQGLGVLARGLGGALLLVGAPVTAAAWVATSPRFALAELEVAGSERVPEAWLRARLAPLVGRNLPLLPLAEVDRVLAGHPWIAGLSVAKRLPAALEVTVTPRRPAALVLEDGLPWYADADGRPIAPVGDEPAAGLLTVTRPEGVTVDGRGVPLALAVARELAAAAPAWARELQSIEVLSDEDARLHTAALPCPLLVRSGRIGERAGRLAALLPEVAVRYPGLAALDLRFARRIVVQPIATTGAGGPMTGQRVVQERG